MTRKGSTLSRMQLESYRSFSTAEQRAQRTAACVALLFVVSICGCKFTSQLPANPNAASPAETANKADFPVKPASSETQSRYGGDPGPGTRRGRADRQAAPGAFDFYLLNLSWSPEFCATHDTSPECGHRLGFVVHGLWPQDDNGSYPEACSDAPGPTNPGAYTDIIPTASLVEHEWQTHGTCSGLSADAYFAEVRKAFATVKIPANIGAGGNSASETPAQLVADFAKANPAFPAESIAISCGNNRLTAIELCLTKDLQAEPCPGIRSCRANIIQVTPK